MILVLNCMLEGNLADSPDRSMQRIARQNNRECRLVSMAEEQTVPPPQSFSLLPT